MHGHPAVGIALHQEIRVSLEPSDRWTFEPHMAELDAFATHLDAVAATECPGVGRARVLVESDLPIGSGFGSSAAFCVALARALAPDRDEHALWSFAHALERFFHGTPSGIDTGLALFGRPTVFTPSSDRTPGALPLAEPAPVPAAHLVVGSVPRSRPARDLIATVSASLGLVRVRDALADLGALAACVAHAEFADAEALGRGADRAHALLTAIGVGSPHIDALLDVARDAGSVGGKLSGAGGGGAFWAVAPDRAAAERIRTALAAAPRPPDPLFIVATDSPLQTQGY